MRRFRMIVAIVLLSSGLLVSGCGSSKSAPGGDAANQTDGATNGDAAPGDAGSSDGGSGDGGAVDAGNLCGPQDMGECTDTTLDCLCCPAGGPANNCLCTTSCLTDGDCTDATRPHCNQPDVSSQGICTSLSYGCAWGSVCAAPDTPIATPAGTRAIASLRVGELVYSLHEGSMQAVPVLRVSRTAVRHHRVRRLRLANGAVLHISAGHPTANGRPFADLIVGEQLGEQRISTIEEVPYDHPYTYDILPASDTGTYIAGGALIGSTLR
jgi:hypothetical protein